MWLAGTLVAAMVVVSAAGAAARRSSECHTSDAKIVAAEPYIPGGLSRVAGPSAFPRHLHLREGAVDHLPPSPSPTDPPPD